MDQMTAQDRRHSRHSLCLVRVLLGSLLALSSLAVDTGPIAAHDADQGSSAARPDFRFKPPWVILGLRGGWAFNRTDGEIYDFFEQNLTLNDSDFDGPAFAMDVAVRAMSWMDVVAGFEVSGRRSKSEFRNFVEASGASIEQKTTLTQVPLTLSLKLYPLGRGRQVGEYAWVRSTLVPYVGGGIGATWYKLKQKGDFVDFADLSIFEAELESDGWAFSQHAFVGLDLKLTRNFGLVLEGRYYWADAALEGDFVDFAPIDLNGARIMAGLSWRL